MIAAQTGIASSAQAGTRTPREQVGAQTASDVVAIAVDAWVTSPGRPVADGCLGTLASCQHRQARRLHSQGIDAHGAVGATDNVTTHCRVIIAVFDMYDEVLEGDVFARRHVCVSVESKRSGIVAAASDKV